MSLNSLIIIIIIIVGNQILMCSHKISSAATLINIYLQNIVIMFFEDSRITRTQKCAIIFMR